MAHFLPIKMLKTSKKLSYLPLIINGKYDQLLVFTSAAEHDRQTASNLYFLIQTAIFSKIFNDLNVFCNLQS